jgi:hypothetical protein
MDSKHKYVGTITWGRVRNKTRKLSPTALVTLLTSAINVYCPNTPIIWPIWNLFLSFNAATACDWGNSCAFQI